MHSRNDAAAMGLRQRVGQAIRVLRRHHGLTLEALAQKARLKTRYLAEIELGKRNPSLETLGRAAGALGVRLEILLQGEGTLPEEPEGRRNALGKILSELHHWRTQELKVALAFLRNLRHWRS